VRPIFRTLGVTAVVVAATALLAARATTPAAVSVTSYWFTPGVVPDDYASPIRLETAVAGGAASVAFEYNLVDRPMFDDGTNGDLVAGDAIWTILFQPSEIIGKLTPGSVFRPFIGFIEAAGASFRFNAFAQIWTPAMGLQPVRQIGNGDQQTDYVVNVIVPAAELQAPNYANRTKRLYAHYSDTFDFVNVISVGNGLSGNRFHSNVRNDVAGIGLGFSDATASHGSRGRLRGYNAYPIPSGFDSASQAYNHEIGHQWINFVSGSPVADGIPHWPKGNIAINVMGWSLAALGNEGVMYSFNFTPNGGGGYLVSTNQAPNSNTVTFNTMELYLMGLVAPAEVGTFFRLNDQNLNVIGGQTLQPADITHFDVNNIIAAAGARAPSSAASPKAFRAATIIASAAPLDAITMSFYDWFARRGEMDQTLPCADGFSQYTCKPFGLATGNRATLSTKMADDEFRKAAFDPAYQAPACRVLSDSCETVGLVNGRGTVFGATELHQPNTIAQTCADVSTGTFLTSPWIAKLSVSTADGSVMSRLKSVRVSATTWINNAATDRLDLYYAASAINPIWTLIGTVVPSGTGTQVLSLNYILPAGSLQAVRAHLRAGGAVSSCGAGFSDDHDDLVFSVGVYLGDTTVIDPDFDNGLTWWTAYGQNPGDITASVTNGAVSFSRAAPPPGQPNQAAIFQNTGGIFAAGQPFLAQFDIGNSSTVRKRLSVLVIESDFSDITVCTFWLAPNSPLRTYGMRAHTRKAWNNAAIYFYAASTGADGGGYLLDNVLLAADNSGSGFKTECLDPTAPVADASADGPELLTNPSFSTGNTSGWGVFQQLTSQVTAGVFQFVRPAATPDPAGGILQSTGLAVGAGETLTAHFQLGNSSIALRRVTVLLHDLDFQDLSACTFWLEPGVALASYTMRSSATKAWANATISVYAATPGNEQWTRLDNVSLRKTNGQTTSGTDCLESGGVEGTPPIDSEQAAPAASMSLRSFAPLPATLGQSEAWTSLAMSVSLASRLAPSGSRVWLQVSDDGSSWRTVVEVPATDEWTWFDLDLDSVAPPPRWMRFIFETAGEVSPLISSKSPVAGVR